ncbi:MAG: PQQ-like beta-propeller repeat protein [Acidobacteria bacterium]|nr:PQQ-like beta-propeller repeat protein [Acidobacteriota bacterium]
MGDGYSSPVVEDNRIYIFTRRGDREFISCLSVDNGRTLWQDSYSAPYRMNPAAVSHGKGPKSTPVLHNGMLFTLGISGILSGYDAPTGKLRWRKDFAAQFPETWPLYGAAMSPVVENGLLIAHVGGHDRGALTAFDAHTGKVEWSWNGDGPGYASPIVVELGGVRQVVTQTQKYVVGVSAADGKLLWRVGFTTAYDQNIVTPVAFQQTIIYSGFAEGTTAIKALPRGENWETEEIWHNTDVSMYMNSPVLSGGLLFGLSHRQKGQFFCLDARTGSTLWASPGRQAENAAMLSLGDSLLVLTNDAELMVVNKSAKGLEVIRRYSVADSPTWAHPVVLGNQILIKDSTTLALWSLE